MYSISKGFDWVELMDDHLIRAKWQFFSHYVRRKWRKVYDDSTDYRF